MTHFGECLREHRKHAGLTQEQLAQKVEASDKSLSASYISKMETGLLPPPSRKAAVGLADALGMSNRPVTLFVSTKDRDALQRFVFFLTAYVAGEEDVQAIRLVAVEDGQGEEREEQANSTPLPTTLNPSLELPESLFNTLEEDVEEIRDLIASTRRTEEEEEMVKSALDTAKRLLKFIAAQRKI